MVKDPQNQNSKRKFDVGNFKSLSSKEQFELLIYLFQSGDFEIVPKNLLTEENTILDGTDKKTVLHLIAKSRQLYLLPPEILTPKALKVRFKDFDANGRPWVGQRLIDTIVSNRCANLVPKENYTKELLEEPRHDGQTLLHLLASTKQFDAVPTENITAENIRLKNKEGSQVLDLISQDQLHLVPGNLLDEEDLLKFTESGDRVLQNYIRRSKLHEIDERWINEKTLLAENTSRVSGLISAATYGYYHKIPKKLLSEKNILKENNQKENLLDTTFKNLVQAEKKEDQAYYLSTCRDLLTRLPKVDMKKLETRLVVKYDLKWKEGLDFLHDLLRTEKLRRAKTAVAGWIKSEKDTLSI